MMAAINLFIAYTLDGIDGKQARRTGTSTPLGELFDHGLDSYSTTIIHIYMFSLFGQNALPPLHMYFIIINATVNFYLTHFEKYNTGVMFLPIAYDYVMCVSSPHIEYCCSQPNLIPFRVFVVLWRLQV